jgi:enamine deaminase RidA (YjgF/YER057c/UK114 family)
MDMVIADVPEERVRAQLLVALDHARNVLEAAGSALTHLVTLRVFLRDIRDASAAAGILKSVLGEQLPATTLIEATGPSVDPTVDVVIDAVGAPLTATAPRHIVIPKLARLTGGLPAATVYGEYVFTAPVTGMDPATGRVGRTRETLTAEECTLLDTAYFNPRDEALAVEQVLMWRNLREILEVTGVAFENILHQNNWLTVSMQQYVPVTKVRSRLFGRGAERTAATSLPVSALRIPHAAFECAVTGLVSGSLLRKEIALDSHGVGPYYVGAVKAGRHVFAAGEVPICAAPGAVPTLIRSAADLPAELRCANLGRVYAEYPLAAQAHYVYHLIDAALKRYDCTMRDVLHQTIYLVEPAQLPLVERIATLHYGTLLPPTTLVPIRGASPFHETLLEIEVTAQTRTA